MFRPLFLLLMPLLVLPALAQTQVPAQQDQQRTSHVKDAVQGGWSNELANDESLLFDAKYGVAVMGADEQLEQLRAVRNDALVRNGGKLLAADQDTIEQLANKVVMTSPGSFEAYMANYYVDFPAAEAFVQLELASARDAQRSELVAPMLVNAARKDQRDELVRCANTMKQRGAIAPGLYNMAADILLSVDKNGVLIAAGEMDAYPLWVEQYADGARPDVLVVDQRLLGDPAYRLRMWERAQARGAVPTDAFGFIQRLHASTDRPVFLSLAVGQQVATTHSTALYITGLAMRMSAAPAGDPAQLEQRWKAMRKDMDIGPLARNFLVPGAALLRHYRTVGDERKASQLELELRGLAARCGATRRMVETGVFQH